MLITFPGSYLDGGTHSVYNISIKGVKVYEHIF
jgi:hypothetical protein